eukprot:8476576-Ditylum_brightwellii.AAC.1
MMTPVDPTRPIALIWKQIEDAQKFAMSAGQPYTNHQIVTTSEMLLLQTNMYHQVYCMWLIQPAVILMYADLQQYFNAEY